MKRLTKKLIREFVKENLKNEKVIDIELIVDTDLEEIRAYVLTISKNHVLRQHLFAQNGSEIKFVCGCIIDTLPNENNLIDKLYDNNFVTI